MSDQVNVQLREDPGEKPKGFREKIAGWFRKTSPELIDHGKKFIGGYAQEKTVKNKNIEQGILDRKASLELEKIKERNRHSELEKEREDDKPLKQAQAKQAESEAHKADAEARKADAEAFEIYAKTLIKAKKNGVRLVGGSLPMGLLLEEEPDDQKTKEVESKEVELLEEKTEDEDTQDDEMAEEVEVE